MSWGSQTVIRLSAATIGVAIVVRVWYVYKVLARSSSVRADGWEIEAITTGIGSNLMLGLVPLFTAFLVASIRRHSWVAQVAAVLGSNILGAMLVYVILGSGYGSTANALKTAEAYLVIGTTFYAVALLARHSLWRVAAERPQ